MPEAKPGARRGKPNPTAKPTMTRPPQGTGSVVGLSFRLYVAGTGPNSTRALDNFKAVVAEFLPDGCDLEVIDILDDPLRALTDGILVTPTLHKVSPPAVTIIGNLSDRAKLLLALGLSGIER